MVNINHINQLRVRKINKNSFINKKLFKAYLQMHSFQHILRKN